MFINRKQDIETSIINNCSTPDLDYVSGGEVGSRGRGGVHGTPGGRGCLGGVVIAGEKQLQQRGPVLPPEIPCKKKNS